MKTFYVRLWTIVAGAALMASCLGGNDDNDTAAYSDAAITQFTLGTLNRYTHTTAAATGNDTVIRTTVTGTNYPMTIDHVSRTIYNAKELPVGTDVQHVVVTVATKNSGVVALQSMASDSLRWHSSTDSISFEKPRVFRVYASDGTAYRDYTATLNISSDRGETFAWTRTMEMGAEAASGQRLVATADTVATTLRDSIIGKTTNEIYTIGNDGMLRASRDGGQTWAEETLDDSPQMLPTAETATVTSWPYSPADNTDYALLVGAPRQSDATTMRVWRKLAYSNGEGLWVYMEFDDSNKYPLPRVETPFVMAPFENTVIGVTADRQVWQSRDQGITWRQNTTYALPTAMGGQPQSMVADAKGRLWLLTTAGELWQGALK